ncbi:hypothetical protein PMIN02_010031 [Paraphaeosphaeria minitans]
MISACLPVEACVVEELPTIFCPANVLLRILENGMRELKGVQEHPSLYYKGSKVLSASATHEGNITAEDPKLIGASAFNHYLSLYIYFETGQLGLQDTVSDAIVVNPMEMTTPDAPSETFVASFNIPPAREILPPEYEWAFLPQTTTSEPEPTGAS